MSQGHRIRTPWKRRWERCRQRVLPLASFLASAILLSWLWKEQGALTDGVGEVAAVRADVVARIDGILVPLPRPEWTLFETVRAGEVVARYDDRAARAKLETFGAEVGMGVEVRTRAAGSRPRESVVECIGPQVEPIPIHQRRNSQMPEWGLPIRVLLPDGLDARPGELIDVTFDERRRDNPG